MRERAKIVKIPQDQFVETTADAQCPAGCTFTCGPTVSF